ncbi:DUF2786 domain-containing protein [Nocardia camponoti]|uniref:DUF2786 domain-containing protein n=1 Tax=Nocardia camponoti TaxID=1616106 RepID=A0A917QUD1_9NOCA|nr:DUF2786 domain-containing protein [Nocardia camponoti]GGK68310.1 hypothetical protein GCM10011591_45550 [Nocardia camponoti]
MGKQNRRKRTGRKATGAQLPLDDARSGDANRVADAVATVAFTAAQGDKTIVDRFVDEVDLGDLSAGVTLAAQRIINRAFDFGWLPADITEAARRRTNDFAVGYLIDLMAEHRADFPAETVDERWQAQLDDLEAEVWWTGSHPVAWAARDLLTSDEALTAILSALALLISLPRLEPIVPLPGTRVSTVAHEHVDAKTLGRVRGLLAKAESTEFPDEAETLSAKAQELMTKYAIDRALLAGTHPLHLPAARRIWLDTPYTDAKALLVDRVASANRVRAVFLADWGFVTIVGDDPDLDAVELLTTSLLVQATRAMIASGDATPGHARSRDYRKAFLTAYATRIGEHLAKATAATVADAPTDLLPVLAATEARVEQACAHYFPTTVARSFTVRSAEGWQAGTSAADRAHMSH